MRYPAPLSREKVPLLGTARGDIYTHSDFFKTKKATKAKPKLTRTRV